MRACSLPAEAGPFEKVVPRSDGKGRAWSDTSDFISTRDSFSSLDEEGYNNSMGGAHAAAQAAQSAAAGVVPPSYAVADGQQAQQVQGVAAPRPSAAVPVHAAQQGLGQVLQAPPRPSSAQAQAPPHQQPPQQALRQSPPQAQPGLPVGGPGAGPGPGQGAGGAPVAVRSASSDGALPRPAGGQWDRRDAPGGAGDPDPGTGAGSGGGQAEDGANGLWRSWWPRRLMPSWSSSEREKAKQKGEAGAEGQAQGPPVQGQGAQAASQQQQQQRMDAGGQAPGQAGEQMASKAGAGLQPGQQGGTGQQGVAGGGSGAAQSAQQGARGTTCGRVAGTGSAADDEGADFGGELHEVCAWVHGCWARDWLRKWYLH